MKHSELTAQWALYVATRDPRYFPNCSDITADNEQQKLARLYRKLLGTN